jgi:beta-lactamase class A
MKKYFWPLMLAAAVLIGTAAGPWISIKVHHIRQERRWAEERKAAWRDLGYRLKREIGRFRGRPGLVVKDLQTGWEYYYRKDRLFASASLSKLPIMAACFKAAEAGDIRLDQEVVLRSQDKLAGSGLLKDLPSGTPFTVERLVDLMISESDNTATNMLTSLMGIDRLNEEFKSFGLQKTLLSRRIADYRARDRGLENYTNASEMAMMLEAMHRRELVSRDVSDRCISTLKLTRANDRIPRYLPSDLTVAHKTGLENGICHDAGIIFTRNGDLLVAVLTEHDHALAGPSKEFIAKVSLAAYEYSDGLKRGD